MPGAGRFIALLRCLAALEFPALTAALAGLRALDTATRIDSHPATVEVHSQAHDGKTVTEVATGFPCTAPLAAARLSRSAAPEASTPCLERDVDKQQRTRPSGTPYGAAVGGDGGRTAFAGRVQL